MLSDKRFIYEEILKNSVHKSVITECLFANIGVYLMMKYDES